jgi:hypothetical protein
MPELIGVAARKIGIPIGFVLRLGPDGPVGPFREVTVSRAQRLIDNHLLVHGSVSVANFRGRLTDYVTTRGECLRSRPRAGEAQRSALNVM